MAGRPKKRARDAEARAFLEQAKQTAGDAVATPPEGAGEEGGHKVANIMNHPALAMLTDETYLIWKAQRDKRRKAGEATIKDVDELHALVKDYVMFMHRNPTIEAKPGQDGKSFLTKRHAPVTLTGLCAFGGFSMRALQMWRNETATEYREDLAPALEGYAEVFKAATIHQATTREIDPGLAARLMGIGDKSEVTITADYAAAGEAARKKGLALLGLGADGKEKKQADAPAEDDGTEE